MTTSVFTGLIEKLDSQPLWLALQIELRTNGHNYGDVEETIKCITKVLTLFIGRDERANAEASAARALAANHRDPAKSGLQPDKTVPTTACKFCGKMHWQSECFRNPRANEATKKLAQKLAPKSPAATGKQPTGTATEPAKPEEPPASSHEPAASLTAQHASEDEALSAALDNAEPSSILLGHAKIAAGPDYDSDSSAESEAISDSQSNLNKAREQVHMRYLEELAAAPRVANIVAHAVPVASISDTRNSSNSSNISYSTNLPHQVYISASENSNCSTPTHSRPSSPTLSPRGSMSRSTTCLVILVGLLSATASAALTAYMAHQTQQEGHGAGLHPHHSSFQLLASTAYTLHSLLALATHSLTSNALSCMQPLCFIAGLASVSPSIYVIVKMLNTLSSRTQASSLQPIEPPSLNNFFTDQLNHLRLSRTSLRHSLTAPFTYLFNLLHVLLLYNVLCPLASLMGLRQPSIGGAADYRRAHFVMVCPLIRPTSMPLPTRRTLTIATVFLLASLWDAISPISSSNDGPSIQQPALAAALLTIEFHPCETGITHHHFHLNHSDTASQHSQRRSPARACLGTSRQTKARSRDLNQHSLVIDSGASFHIHPHLDDLINVKTCSTRILGVGQSSHQCTAIGDMPIRAKASDGKERDLILRNVRYASSFTDTLISVGQLWQDSAVDAVFKDECCLVLPCGLKFPFSKGKGAGLYMWKVTPIRPSVNSIRDHISRFARDALPKSPSPPSNRQLRALSFHTRSSKSISHIASLHPDVAARYMHRRLSLIHI